MIETIESSVGIVDGENLKPDCRREDLEWIACGFEESSFSAIALA
jgi:hypothetical protein